MNTSAIVVGAGVIGLAITDRLAAHGVHVTVLDAGARGQASWAASGSLSLIMPQLAPPALRALAADSQRRWLEFAQRVEDRAGVSIERESTGLLRLVLSPETADSVAATKQWLDRAGILCETVDRAQIRAIAPLASPDVETALYQPELWRLRPPRLLTALEVSLTTRASVTIRRQCRVARLIRTGARIHGVELTTGERLHADEVIACAGAWSGEILTPILGRPLPVHPVRGQMVCLDASRVAGRVAGPALLGETNAYAIPRRGARVVAGSTFEDVGFDSRVTADGLQHILHEVLRIAPDLAGMPIERTWTGLRPASADGLPFIGRVDGLDGLVVATGHFRDGILLTPATMAIVVALVEGREPEIDIRPYLPCRA